MEEDRETVKTEHKSKEKWSERERNGLEKATERLLERVPLNIALQTTEMKKVGFSLSPPSLCLSLSLKYPYVSLILKPSAVYSAATKDSTPKQRIFPKDQNLHGQTNYAKPPV